MHSIFEFTNYREYLHAWIELQGARSYGLKGKIAIHLGISSSLVSQILKGDKTLTPDQASDLADYVGLSDAETDYFHLLLEIDRAGNHRYQEKLRRKIAAAQRESKNIGKRVPRNAELTNEQKAIYYSSWLFTGIRNMTAVPEFSNVDALSKRLGVDVSIVNRVLRFLLENGLCIEADGKLSYGPASIHVDKESPFVNKHHQNWRIQAIQKMENKKSDDIFFTSPMSLSKDAVEEVRLLLPTVIQNVMKIVGPSSSETTACLNIDWFEY
jgi:uncharacterized protein (TIGR02147 family)